ncbi:hypothetical protein DFH11DRAFT_1759435 [Phellopilus nigrolimitatus]|nr:hypothetical protein DFH11DRAFT_1759418 [Phellopilus nigrolimitatus]KAH8115329.1 hypothetical protein DFH11DRAFT_1759424 [Phellopilus nigrolimitatus]KAH8115332.1 hypothetical protein DFH11DRAFT_1759435 [Phellopilus nigrolimitatus]
MSRVLSRAERVTCLRPSVYWETMQNDALQDRELSHSDTTKRTKFSVDAAAAQIIRFDSLVPVVHVLHRRCAGSGAVSSLKQRAERTIVRLIRKKFIWHGATLSTYARICAPWHARHAGLKTRRHDRNDAGERHFGHAVDITSDKPRSLARKWQTLIEAHRPMQVKKTTYAQSSLRKKMFDLQGVVMRPQRALQKFIPEAIGREIDARTVGASLVMQFLYSIGGHCSRF